MIVFILKFIACTGVLLLFYYGFLQNEKLFRFNRFFLLAIVVLSLVIPITIVRTKIIDVPVYEAPVYTQMETLRSDREDFMAIPPAIDTVNETLLTLANVLWISYFLVTSLLLIRFMRNLFTILKLKRKSLIVVENGVKIVLRNDIKASFSFLSHMYTNRTRYEQGKLPIEIIEHEKHHIDQKHSFDIIFIELLQCLLWFNPFVYFIKSAIKLNHEFLADQHVLKDDTSVYIYQKILLDITRKQFVTTPAFASNLNYGFTKKRLNMMTKNTNKFKSMIKQLTAASVIACAFWLGGETRVIAQEKEILVDLKVKEDSKTTSTLGPEISIDLKVKVDLQDTIKPKSDQQMVRIKRMGSIVKKNTLIRFLDQEGKLVEKKYQDLTKAEEARFKDLSSSPQFFLPPPPKGMMNQTLLDDFMDAKKYGIWVDGKRIENSEIANYKPKDFHHFFKSKLYKNAKDYGKYQYHLGLTTNKQFESMGDSKGSWLDYKNPTIIEIPEQKTSKDKGNQEPSEVAAVKSKKLKEKSKTLKEKNLDQKLSYLIPRTVKFKNGKGAYVEKSFGQLTSDEKLLLISEEGDGRYLAGTWDKNSKVPIEKLQKTYNPQKYRLSIDEKPAELDLLKNINPETLFTFWIQPSNDFLKQDIIMVWTKKYFDERFEITPSGRLWSKLVEVKSVRKEKVDSQELGIKKGGFNPELHSPGIDLEKVEYFLAPTFSAHLKYTDNSGRSVVKTYGEMTDDEYSMWVNPKNNGQIFNPPAPKEEITMSRLIELKNQEEIEFWINGEKAEPQAIIALRYHEIYDMTVTETKADIITDLVFLQDDSAWMSRIRYKKVE